MNNNQYKINENLENFGVNISAYFNAESGFGETARCFVNTFQMLNIPIVLNNFSFYCQQRQEDFMLNNFTAENPYPINLIILNPPEFQKFLSQYSINYLKNKYNIGVWKFSFSEIPDSWQDFFNYFDEIWVESDFIYDTVKTKSPIPVFKIPPFISVNLFETYKKNSFGIKENEFIFLDFFDFFDGMEIKNPEGLIKAFLMSFDKDEPVRLIIKTTGGDNNIFKKDFKYLNSLSEKGNIDVIEGYLTPNDRLGLISICDCYCSLHKITGFPHVLIEAMNFKKPVIATAWSGNMDFMNISNSYPVEYSLTHLRQSFGNDREGQLCAEPDIEHAAKLMREVYENRETSIKKAYEGFADIKKLYSSEDNLKKIQIKIDNTYNFLYGSELDENQKLLKYNYNFKKSLSGELFNAKNEIDRIKEAIPNIVNQINSSFEKLNNFISALVLKYNVKPNGLPGFLFKHFEDDEVGLSYINESGKSNESFDYIGFENAFRGSEQEIKERQRKYLRFFKKGMKVLDVACGRGEFLELMNELECDATGLDINAGMIARCKAKGLNAVCAEAIEYIKSFKMFQINGIFSSQFIEHLCFEDLYKFFLYSCNALENGGVFIAETINPYHYESMNRFYFDPSHVKPIFPETSLFLCYSAGFKKARIFYHFNESFSDINNNQPDYAVIAWK
jgi:glycosyltransferase involved in cell wall biosynthesis/2-polyprenyl-3-methyl-5-hydroxy-6-metoxy-1,4-benzoquinol methylase